MKTVVIVVGLVIFLVIDYIAMQGLDLRKWKNWLYGLGGFLCGLMMGLSLTANLAESLKVGAIFAFLILVGGATMRWHKQRYEGMAKSLFLQYGKEDDPSLFAKLVRRLLGKYQK